MKLNESINELDNSKDIVKILESLADDLVDARVHLIKGTEIQKKGIPLLLHQVQADMRYIARTIKKYGKL